MLMDALHTAPAMISSCIMIIILNHCYSLAVCGARKKNVHNLVSPTSYTKRNQPMQIRDNI